MSTVPNQRLVSPKPAVGAAMPRDTSPWQICLQHRQPSPQGQVRQPGKPVSLALADEQPEFSY